MTKTEHLKLPQWDLADQVRMKDFNDAFAAIDKGCGNLRVTVGTYTGTGQVGSDKPTVLPFSGRPLLVWVFCNDYDVALLYGRTYSVIKTVERGIRLSVTWAEGSVSWYVLSGTSASAQLNEEGTTYTYYILEACTDR